MLVNGKRRKTKQPIDNHKIALRKAYDGKAQERELTDPAPWKAALRQSFLDRLQQTGAKTLLELGAGSGKDSKFFQDQGLDVTCVDLSPELVKLCQQKGLNAQVCDFTELDYAPNSFDAVYALNSLLHISKAELPAILENIRTILSPSGLFYMGVWGGPSSEKIWAQDSYDPPRFFSFYPDDKIQALLSSYFKIHTFERLENLQPDDRIHMQSIVMGQR